MSRDGGATAGSAAPRGAQRCRVVGRGTAAPHVACVRARAEESHDLRAKTTYLVKQINLWPSYNCLRL